MTARVSRTKPPVAAPTGIPSEPPPSQQGLRPSRQQDGIGKYGWGRLPYALHVPSGGRVRPIAIGVVRDRERLLVAEGRDMAKGGQVFYRPLGGAIEFGERAAEAVRREFGEEISADVEVGPLLGVIENVFVYEDQPGHEIVFVLEARLQDSRLRGVDSIASVESDGTGFVARWMPLETFRSGTVPLYPDGLLELISKPPVIDAD